MKAPSISDLKNRILSNKTLFALLVTGAALRLRHYLENRSFWADEAYAALNVNGRNFLQLLAGFPLDRNLPFPPVGFLLAQKWNVLVFGNNEYAFRLFPLVCGILSVLIFYKVFKRYADPRAVLCALVLFVFNERLIYYSAEAKRYLGEILVVLLLYWLASIMKNNKLSWAQVCFCSLIGIVSILFSYSALFVLLALAFVQLIVMINNKERQKTYRALVIFYIWFFFFALMYFFYFQEVKPKIAVNYWKDQFFGFYSWGAGPVWLWDKTMEFFKDPACLAPSGLAMLFCVTGLFWLWNKNKEKCSLLLLPFFMALLASGFKKYPFHGRFLLFCVPSVLIFVSAGVLFFYDKLKARSRFLAWIVIISVFVFPVGGSGRMFFDGYGFEETRPVMQFMKKHYRPGDQVFVNNLGKAGYFYYLPYCGFDPWKMSQIFFSDKIYTKDQNQGSFLVLGKQYPFFDNEGRVLGDVKEMEIIFKRMEEIKEKGVFGRNKRTWFFFSHCKQTKQLIIDYFDKTGERMLDSQAQGAGIYLYDLSL